MSTLKNPLDDQDPDYSIPVSTNKNQEDVCEENARTTARKITAIIEKEFSQEIDTKKNEVLQIQEKLHKALKTLHLLRYVIITDFYNRKQCQASQTRETQQVRIHPAIKQLIGKGPKRSHNDFAVPSTSTDPRFLNGYSHPSPIETRTVEQNDLKTENTTEPTIECNTAMQFVEQTIEDDTPPPKKIPRYVPPKSGLPEPVCPSRGVRHKVRKRIVIGNISKWIPPDWREDAASHKWTIYVRGSKEVSNIGDFVSKVRFFLHPSYRPNDVVEVSSAPFHLSRRGWGEFPLRVQLHFKNAINKPMDIIHHLKLDSTYTGLQTLGSETIVDVWIHTMEPNALMQTNEETTDSSTEVANFSAITDEKKSNTVIDRISKTSNISIDPAMITVKNETDNTGVPNIDNNLKDMDSNIQLDICSIKSESDNDHAQSMSFMTNDIILSTSLNCDSNIARLEKMRFSIFHDHDYFDNSYSNEKNSYVERNITIEHSSGITSTYSSKVSTHSNLIKKPIHSITELSSNNINTIKQFSTINQCTYSGNTEKCVEVNSGATPINNKNNTERDSSGDSNNTSKKFGSSLLWVKDPNELLTSSESLDSTNLATKTDLLKQGEDSFEKIMQTAHLGGNINETRSASLPMDSKSNLSPLEISIPPSFEPTVGRHMLILQNNKRASIETNNSCLSRLNTVKYIKNCKVDINNCLNNINSKTSILIPQGVSLLKKQLIQTGKANSNNKSAHDSTEAVLEIKPSRSLLLNMNSDVPALKIVDNSSDSMNYLYNTKPSHSETLQKDSILPKPIHQNGKIAKSRIILGKDKLKLNSKEDLYDEVLKSIEMAKITNVEGLLRFIIRRIPIVTPYASDPDYRRLHPYACVSEEEYFNHNVGKRAAYEWWRAKTIRSFLRKKIRPEDKLWSIKEIILWARLHGYTPTRSCFGIDGTITVNGAKRLPCSEISATSTCTEPIAFQKWLQTCSDTSKNATIDNNDSQEEDIDIITFQNPVNNKMLQQRHTKSDLSKDTLSSKMTSLDLEEKLIPLHNFVCETTRSIGITLKPEEIIPNVLHCTASRTIIRAMECFLEDLVRASLAKAWEKSNGKEYPQVLSLDDVRSAITSREEFDIFTNEGLGSRYQLSTTD